MRAQDNQFTEMCSGSEAGLYLRLIDFCITQRKAQGPSRTCNESKEEALRFAAGRVAQMVVQDLGIQFNVLRRPGEGISSSHGARPVRSLILEIKWTRTSRVSIRNSLSCSFSLALSHTLSLTLSLARSLFLSHSSSLSLSLSFALPLPLPVYLSLHLLLSLSQGRRCATGRLSRRRSTASRASPSTQARRV